MWRPRSALLGALVARRSCGRQVSGTVRAIRADAWVRGAVATAGAGGHGDSGMSANGLRGRHQSSEPRTALAVAAVTAASRQIRAHPAKKMPVPQAAATRP